MPQTTKNRLIPNPTDHKKVCRIPLHFDNDDNAIFQLQLFDETIPGIATIGAIFRAKDSKNSSYAIIPISEVPRIIEYLQNAYDNANSKT